MGRQSAELRRTVGVVAKEPAHRWRALHRGLRVIEPLDHRRERVCSRDSTVQVDRVAPGVLPDRLRVLVDRVGSQVLQLQTAGVQQRGAWRVWLDPPGGLLPLVAGGPGENHRQQTDRSQHARTTPGGVQKCVDAVHEPAYHFVPAAPATTTASTDKPNRAEKSRERTRSESRIPNIE